jgi:U3 small nucleolar ribonucleoprotein component
MQEEVINIFNVLSRKLNELSHFYFTPKPIIEETSAKVLANQRSLPAIEMEDVTPFNINSSSSQNAPQEVRILFWFFLSV